MCRKINVSVIIKRQEVPASRITLAPRVCPLLTPYEVPLLERTGVW
jgi:hypothetical protein